MKIGILTFPKAINYGTSLQALALKKVVDSLGVEGVFMDHKCDAIDKSNKIFDIKCALSPSYTLAHLYNLPSALKRQKAFRKFWDAHFAFGNDDPLAYDAVVAGSDQIWNYNLTGEDWFYFLDFPKSNTVKATYAASFGLPRVDEKYVDTLKPLLKDIEYLSVRENTAADIVKDISGIDAPVVLDPTLLLNKQQWENFANRPDDSGYIYVYTVFNSESLWDFAYKLSEKTGLPIKTVSYSKFHRHNADYSFTAGPAEWLGYMLNADYVVTNSFHGFAFSTNFGKQFFYELPPKSSGVGSRLADMAKSYGLCDRELKVADMDKQIDYTAVYEKLDAARENSMYFLRKIVSKD